MKIVPKTLLASLVIAAAGSVSAQSFTCVTTNVCDGASFLSWSFANNKLTIENNAALGSVGASSFIGKISFDYSKNVMDVQYAAGDQMSGVSFAMTSNDEAGMPGNKALGWTNDEGATQTKGEVAKNKNGNGNGNAVQPGEKVVFRLTGVTLENIGTSFRFGVHLQGLNNVAGSEKLVPVSAVPEPESYAMMLAGLGLMVGIARRRQRKV